MMLKTDHDYSPLPIPHSGWGGEVGVRSMNPEGMDHLGAMHYGVHCQELRPGGLIQNSHSRCRHGTVEAKS